MFILLAIDPFIKHLYPKNPYATQPHLFVPMLLASLLLILPLFKISFTERLRAFPQYITIGWYLIFIWSLITVFRDFSFTIYSIRGLFGTDTGFGLWVAPVAIFAGSQIAFWKSIKNTLFLHTKIGVLIGILFCLFYIKGTQILDYPSATSFVYAAGFLLLSGTFKKKES